MERAGGLPRGQFDHGAPPAMLILALSKGSSTATALAVAATAHPAFWESGLLCRSLSGCKK